MTRDGGSEVNSRQTLRDRSRTNGSRSQAVTAAKSIATDPAEIAPSRDDILEWLATQEALLHAHQGEWVAFVGREIVAHAPTFLDVMQQIESRGIEDPFLVPVPPDQPFIG